MESPGDENYRWHECTWTRRRSNNVSCYAKLQRDEIDDAGRAVQCKSDLIGEFRQIDGEDETWDFTSVNQKIQGKDQEVCQLEIPANKNWKVGRKNEYTDWICKLEQCIDDKCKEGNNCFGSNKIVVGVETFRNNLKNIPITSYLPVLVVFSQ